MREVRDERDGRSVHRRRRWSRRRRARRSPRSTRPPARCWPRSGRRATADVDRAVAAAREGFAVWSAMTGAERSRDPAAGRRDPARRATTSSPGSRCRTRASRSPRRITVDVVSGADCLEFFAAAAATLHGEYHDLGGAFAYTRREPLGVCAAIGAWNYPIQIACWKSAPALAAGNAMVFKPSELTPLTAMELAAVYTEAGPAGRACSTSCRATVGSVRRSPSTRGSPRSRSPARSPPGSG